MNANTETDVKQRLAALRATLAGATMACPDCSYHGIRTLGAPCETCHGTGEVARFPGMRQVCHWRKAVLLPCPEDCVDDEFHLHNGAEHMDDCKGCGGRRWQVRAGGMEDALAGLNKQQAMNLCYLLESWIYPNPSEEDLDDGPMPDRDTILVKTLELVIEAAGLEERGSR